VSQLSLFGDPEPVPVATVTPVAMGLRERLMEALRRDVESLQPKHREKMSPDVPALLEERIADYRRRLAALEEGEVR